VAMSQRVAAELTGLLKERLGEQTVTCVISASATDDPAISKWRRSRQERKQVEADFKDPEHPLKVVVVRDMWLTGFDVPSLYTIYIDKPMRDHGLLQAIARVNRVFREYGLFARLYKLLRPNPAGIAVADDEEFFRKVAGAVIKIAPPRGQVSRETEQVVKQFVSEGLTAGEVIDVFELDEDGRP